jgi:hypothetical protein
VRESQDEPIFTGWQPRVIELETEDAVRFVFVGGIHGLSEDGKSNYEE